MSNSSLFTLKLRDNSMSNQKESPNIPMGVVVFIDPDLLPINGKFVAVSAPGLDGMVLRKLVVTNSRKYLVALNDNYPPIEIDGNTTTHGVAIKYEMDV